jgi:hypothetical protein
MMTVRLTFSMHMVCSILVYGGVILGNDKNDTVSPIYKNVSPSYHLQNIETLDLSAIADKEYTTLLTTHPRLKLLSINKNALISPLPTKHTTLQNLIICTGTLQKFHIPYHLASLPNLVTLTLSNNQLQDVGNVEPRSSCLDENAWQHTNLQNLDISNNQLSRLNIQIVETLPNLVTCNISSNLLDDVILPNGPFNHRKHQLQIIAHNTNINTTTQVAVINKTTRPTEVRERLMGIGMGIGFGIGATVPIFTTASLLLQFPIPLEYLPLVIMGQNLCSISASTAISYAICSYLLSSKHYWYKPCTVDFGSNSSNRNDKNNDTELQRLIAE